VNRQLETVKIFETQMAEELYDIFFAGKTLPGEDPLEARRKVGSLFKADDEALDRLFSGTAVRVKTGVDQETAIKYRVVFRNAGALVEIRPSDQTAPVSLTLLPPNTGSLIDCAPSIEALPLPDISDYTLSPAGAALDESRPVPDPAIDTSGLSLGPAGSGSLEEFHRSVEPAPIPDIDHLRLD
jgi:hypothetical protein